ncbi:EF-hand domain-containing protein [Streptomyces sp. NBC_01565]|uniref:EF-hand domain-containing protein n=1 Tax=unclassified Streptomyces TaxID=2593676 RepID=UPI00225C0B65|nr:EF-hand domain-containing protein [Streptomyces sp. NBC_01565]MCX4546358.1 EF-hand domain-containing protein [Streptomyces sp. NBC_01565]
MSVLDMKLDRSFDVFDADRDGRLEKADVIGLSDKLAESLGVAPDAVAGLRDSLADLWDTVFERMDRNGDGGVDRQEFRASFRARIVSDQNRIWERIRNMSNAWTELGDRDGDGMLSKEEYTSLLHGMFRLPRQTCDEAFDQLDSDGDGQLSRDEISSAMKEYYTSENYAARGNQFFGRL